MREPEVAGTPRGVRAAAQGAPAQRLRAAFAPSPAQSTPCQDRFALEGKKAPYERWLTKAESRAPHGARAD